MALLLVLLAVLPMPVVVVAAEVTAEGLEAMVATELRTTTDCPFIPSTPSDPAPKQAQI